MMSQLTKQLQQLFDLTTDTTNVQLVQRMPLIRQRLSVLIVRQLQQTTATNDTAVDTTITNTPTDTNSY